MLLSPRWVGMLPRHLRPEKEKIKELEKLRKNYNIPHKLFSLRVLSSPSTTIKAQRESFKRLKRINPYASEKKLLRMVLKERLQTPPVTPMTKEEIDEAMEDINTFEDLCDFIIFLDEQEPGTPDPFGIGKRIDKILALDTVEESGRRNKNPVLKTSNGEVSIDTFLNKLNRLLQNELIKANELFGEIIKLQFPMIISKMELLPVLPRLDLKDIGAFCDALIRHGVGVAIVLFEFLENKRIKIKKPPYSKEAYEIIFEKYSEEDLSKRCPCDWVFVKNVLDGVVNTQAENLLMQRSWGGVSMDAINTIKEPFIREFVYRGFSIGLESAGY